MDVRQQNKAQGYGAVPPDYDSKATVYGEHLFRRLNPTGGNKPILSDDDNQSLGSSIYEKDISHASLDESGIYTGASDTSSMVSDTDSVVVSDTKTDAFDHVRQVSKNPRLRLLDYVPESNREVFYRYVVDNDQRYGEPARRMKQAYHRCDWGSEVLLGADAFNTLIYLYINDKDFKESDFVELQSWLQVQQHFQHHRGATLEKLKFDDRSGTAQNFRETYKSELVDLDFLIGQLAKPQRYLTQITYDPEQSELFREHQLFWNSKDRAYRRLPTSDERQKLYENFEWLMYAVDFGYAFIDTSSADGTVKVTLPSYEIYCLLLTHLAQSDKPVKPVPCFGEPNITQLAEFRKANEHPLSLYHPWIDSSITRPDGRYAGYFLGTIHDLLHVYLLNTYLHHERQEFYQLFEGIRDDLSAWSKGERQLPDDFVKFATEFMGEPELETIRTIDWGDDPWALFNLLDLPRTLKPDEEDRHHNVLLNFIRLAFDESAVDKHRRDLVLAQAYFIYCLCNDKLSWLGESDDQYSLVSWIKDEAIGSVKEPVRAAIKRCLDICRKSAEQPSRQESEKDVKFFLD